MKKLLLISYYFPPCGGAGVQRWLRFIRYLPEQGWLPTVITTCEGDYPVLDPSLCKKIPDQIRVTRSKTPVFGKILKLFKSEKEGDYPYGSLRTRKDDKLSKKILYWIRNNTVVPDSRVVWNKTAYTVALRELRMRHYDLVITTGPPHSTHLVGMELKKRFPIKWIADFRDPWTNIYYLQKIQQNKLLLKLNRKLEKEVVETADLNIIVSQSISDSLPEGNKVVLTNGFDPEDFFNVETIPSTFFRVKYIGKLTEGQDVEQPLQWLNEMSRDDKISNIEFSFVGTLPGSDRYEKDNPYLHIRNVDYLTHLRAVSEMVNADLLLLLVNDCPDNKGILTTKLFEYIGSGTSILGIGPKDSEAAEILHEYNAGTMVAYGDKEAFALYVIETYDLWSEGEKSKNKTDVSALSTPCQVKILADLLDEMRD